MFRIYFVVFPKSSSYIRIHKVFAVSNFTMKEQDLQLSEVFLKSLNNLPLEYNYALYSRIFDDFGTHYYTSGLLGGKYDLLYQFSEEEIKNSGMWVHMMWVLKIQYKISISLFLMICLEIKNLSREDGSLNGN